MAKLLIKCSYVYSGFVFFQCVQFVVNIWKKRAVVENPANVVLENPANVNNPANVVYGHPVDVVFENPGNVVYYPNNNLPAGFDSVGYYWEVLFVCGVLYVILCPSTNQPSTNTENPPTNTERIFTNSWNGIHKFLTAPIPIQFKNRVIIHTNLLEGIVWFFRLKILSVTIKKLFNNHKVKQFLHNHKVKQFLNKFLKSSKKPHKKKKTKKFYVYGVKIVLGTISVASGEKSYIYIFLLIFSTVIYCSQNCKYISKINKYDFLN